MSHTLERISEFCERAGAEWVVWILGALFLVALAVATRRVWAMHFLSGDPIKLMATLQPVFTEKAAAAGLQDQMLERLRQTSSVAAALCEAAIGQWCRGSHAAAQAVETHVLIERLRLERGLGVLSTIATNAPFVGLLGTVIGVMHAFAALGAEQPHADLSSALMRGVAEALVTTGVGLAVALPTVVAHNYLQSRGEAVLSSARALAGQVVVAMSLAREATPLDEAA